MATNVLDKVAATMAKRAPVDAEYLAVVAKLGRGDNVTEAAVEAALASSGRTLAQMRADVAAAAERLRLDGIVATGPALAVELAEAGERITELETALREVTAELTSQLQAAGAVRAQVQQRVRVVAAAETRLNELENAKPEVQARRNKLFAIGLQRGRIASALEQLPPPADPHERATLEARRRDVGDSLSPYASKRPFVEIADRLTELDRLDAADDKRQKLLRQLAVLDAEIESLLKAGAQA